MTEGHLISKPEDKRFDSWIDTTRRALVIGINTYQCNEIHNLQGCANDAERIGVLLEQRFKFGVVLLTDTEATRDKILESFHVLLQSVEKGGPSADGEAVKPQEVVLFWSGHGSQIQSRQYGYYESLVPHDSHHPAEDGDCTDPNRDLIECELYAWALRLTRSANLTLLIDACKGGGMVRDVAALPRGVRHERRPDALRDKTAFFVDSELWGMEAPLRPQSRRAASSTANGLEEGLARYRDIRPPSDRYTLLAACRDNQFCREMKDPESGKHHGIFSLHLARALLKMPRFTSWRELRDTLASRIMLVHPEQEVQLEGAVDRKIFDTDILRPEPFLPIEEINGAEFVLGGGTAQGVLPGSIWRCFPPGTRQTDPSPLAEIRIHRTSFDQSQGRSRSRKSAEAADLSRSLIHGRAFEHSRPVERRLRVTRPHPWSGSKEALEHLEASPLLSWKSTPGEADVIILTLPPRTEPKEDPLPTLGPLYEAHWAIFDPIRDRQVAPARPSEGGGLSATRQLRLDLECLARQRFLLDLSHPLPERSLAHEIRFGLHRLKPGGDWKDVRPGAYFAIGDQVAFSLERREGMSADEPIYLAVLDLGLAGAITSVYPRRGRQSAWRSRRWELGWRLDDRLVMRCPPGYPFRGEPPMEDRNNGAVETVILFLSRRYSDLEYLDQDSLGPVRNDSGSTLGPILARALARSNYRSGAPKAHFADMETWGLIHCPIRVFRRE